MSNSVSSFSSIKEENVVTIDDQNSDKKASKSNDEIQIIGHKAFTDYGTKFGENEHELKRLNVKKDEETSDKHKKKSKFEIHSLFEDKFKRAHLLEWLNAHHYTILAKELYGKNEFPWDSIREMNSPVLMEQLVTLYHLLNKKYTSIMQFALDLAKKTDPNTIKKTISLIGKLITLADHDLDSVDCSVKWINTTFDQKIQSIKKRQESYYQNHKNTGLQSAEIATRTRLPIELARILFTRTGAFNVGLIEPLINAFIVNKHDPRNFEINLLYTLRALQFLPLLQEKLSTITKPHSSKDQANVVIQILLGLSPEITVTDLHAKQTILAALMSHLRQGPHGACFAACVAIQLMTSRLDLCLDDFTSLIKKSKLTRTINGVKQDFPFLLKISDHNLKTLFSIDKTGEVKDGGYLWEAPGIQSACKDLGIRNPHETIRNMIKECDSLQFTVRKILEMLTTLVKGSGLHFSRACFAFEAQENNPMLKVWENAIAGMAEAKESGMVKSAIVDAIYKAIKSKYPNKKILRVIRSELYNRIHLHYDPLVYGKIYEGAFVLYDRNNTFQSSKWKRVDNPKAFQDFMSSVIDSTNSGTLVANYVEKDSFVLTTLSNYYKGNLKIKDPINNYKELKYTPWVTKSGNHLNTVLQIYFEEDPAREFITVTPQDSQELLTRLIEIGKTKHEPENPFKLIPTRIEGVHAFSLMFGHQTHRNALEDSLTPKEWIDMRIIKPAKEIAKIQLDSSTIEKMIQYVCNKLLSKNKVSQFLDQIQKIPKQISLDNFRKQALDLIISIGSGKNQTSKEIALLFDKEYYKNLPISLKKNLEKLYVHLADTNWNDGIHDLHLCFTINPGTSELETWACRDDGTKIMVLDQKQWVSNQKWKIY